jgi:hypothetical protein
MPGFREAVLASGSSGFGWTSHSGSGPTPFDAVDGARLAGPQGSHPLAGVSIEELVRRSTDGLQGQITIDNPEAIRIGEGISGRLTLTARKNIGARSAALRLVGARMAEENKSYEERDSKGNVIRSDYWVEVNGSLFAEEAYLDLPLPAAMSAGQTFDAPFTIPAPRLGPVSAHVGSALIGWAVEAKWDISMGGDERLAVPVTVHQNLDYLRSGAVRLESGAMFDLWSEGDGSIGVKPLPPIVAGTPVEVTVTWPSAGSGRGGRFELQANVDAPNGLKGLVLWSTGVDPAAFRSGTTFTVVVPPDAPPTFADQGLAVNYRLRALVDRSFRSDLAIERALAVV